MHPNLSDKMNNPTKSLTNDGPMPGNTHVRDYRDFEPVAGNRPMRHDGVTTKDGESGRTLPQTGDVRYQIGCGEDHDHPPFPAGGTAATKL